MTETYKNPKLKEEMQFITHKSGLKIYLFPKKGFTKYYAIYGTEYGSVDRTFKVPGENETITVPDGIAHYLEHKLFEEEGGNAFDRFAITGASCNAFTSFDMTAYLFSCTDNFYQNLDILVDFVNHPYFTPENVKKEQGIIGQEIQMYDDEPEWRVFFNTLTAMYHNNPVKIDIAGTVESISHITPELLYKCYNTFYNPANMVLVLVGDIKMDAVLEIVDKYLDADRNLGKIKREPVLEPTQRVQEKIEQKMMVSQPLFRIGFKDNNLGGNSDTMLEKEIATELILQVLFSKKGDLYNKLYEDGLIDDTFDYETDMSDTYGFTLIGGASKDPEKVYQTVKEYINSMVKDGIPPTDIDMARKTLIASNIRIFNSVERMGNAFIRSVMAGTNPLSYSEAVAKVTDTIVFNRLKEHFDTSNCVLSVVSPQ